MLPSRESGCKGNAFSSYNGFYASSTRKRLYFINKKNYPPTHVEG